MTRRAKLLILGLIVVAALAVGAFLVGPVIYRDLIAAPADDAPSAELEADGALEPSTLDEQALAGDWVVTAGSFAGYRVEEVLNGADVTVTGRTEEVSGTVATSQTEVIAAMITVDVASIATDSANRDAYFRDTALRVAEHPTATFELTSPIPAPDGNSLEGPQTVEASGVLTLAGESREVTVSLTAAVSGSTVRIAGQVPITFSDFGVDAPSLGFVSVDDEGFVEFLVVLEQVG